MPSLSLKLYNQAVKRGGGEILREKRRKKNISAIHLPLYLKSIDLKCENQFSLHASHEASSLTQETDRDTQTSKTYTPLYTPLHFDWFSRELRDRELQYKGNLFERIYTMKKTLLLQCVNTLKNT